MTRFDSTCWSVVLGAAAGSSADRDEFCRRYDPVIRAYLGARWHLSRQHADVAEGVQEVLLQCLQPNGALGRADPEREGGFRAFLYGVTSRAAVQIERRKARHGRDHAGTGFEPDRVERDERTLSQAFDRAWAEMVGKEARRLLAERARNEPAVAERLRYLELRYVQNLPPREIATRLEVPVERIYEGLRNAKEDYRRSLLEVMATYFPGTPHGELERRCADLAQSL